MPRVRKHLRIATGGGFERGDVAQVMVRRRTFGQPALDGIIVFVPTNFAGRPIETPPFVWKVEDVTIDNSWVAAQMVPAYAAWLASIGATEADGDPV